MQSGEAPSLPPLPLRREWMRFPRLPSRGTRSQGRVRQACPGGPSHPPKDPLLPTCTPQQITMTVAGCGRLRRPSTQPALRTRRWRKPGSQVTKREGFQRKCWGPVQQPPNVSGQRRDHEWYGSPGKDTGDSGAARWRVSKGVIPDPGQGISVRVRGAACSPATERKLSGQSAGFE
jgi:hypothetical protein